MDSSISDAKPAESINNIETPAALNNPQLKLHRIYTKSSLFEAASMTLDSIENPPQPIVSMQVTTNAYSQKNNLFEAVLSLQLSAKHNDNLLWRANLQQAGLYTLENIKEVKQKELLNIFCMSQLYPYACVMLNNMVTQGGFLPVYLNPINFEEIFKQQKQ